jgi:hypothetical protein
MIDWFKRHSFVIPVLTALAITLVCARRGMSQAQILMIVVPFAVVYAILDWGWQTKRPPRQLPPRKPSKPAVPYVSPYVVTFDDCEIVVTFKQKRRESVRWDDIVLVGIHIENEGFLDLPYWIIAGKPGGCGYSNDAIGGLEILTALQNRLPGFNNVAVAQAMVLLSGGVRVWERESVAADQAPTG